MSNSFEELIESVGRAPEFMTWVIYGKNGTGKTTLGASGKDTLVAEIEKDGTFSVRGKSDAKKVRIKTWDDFEKLYWYLKDNAHRYNILVLDTLTRLQELCIRKVVLGDKKADNADLMDDDVVKITLQQRGYIAQKMVYWLNAYNNLPIHKVWLCQEAGNSEDLDVKDYEAYPDLTRKIRIYVCSDATVIARTIVKTREVVENGVMTRHPVFVLSTSPVEGYLIKDRTNVLGKGAIDPRIDELIERVYKADE